LPVGATNKVRPDAAPWALTWLAVAPSAKTKNAVARRLRRCNAMLWNIDVTFPSNARAGQQSGRVAC
jgi:hypothetical protein